MTEMKTRVLFALLILLILIPSGSLLYPAVKTPPSAEADYQAAITTFSQYAEKQIQRDRIPGMSIGFIKDDFIWTTGFGFADLENSVPAAPESSYRLASITKTITALGVLQLVEAGKIVLDDEVQTYVPYFPRKRWPVTVRQLLGHLGGISHYRDPEKEQHFKYHKSTREALAVFQDFNLIAKPGTRYVYSSYGYNLLGAVIEGASGQSYGDYIRDHIFAPLDMGSSRMDSPVDLIPHRVKGYRLLAGKIGHSEFVDVSSRFAGGGTRSSIIDLLKYAKAIIAGNLLQKQTWRTMFTSMATQGGYLTGYGMGWRVGSLKGHFQVSHSGSQPETRTALLILPVEKFAVAVAVNLERADLTPYVQRLAELVLNEDLDSTAYLPDPWEQALFNAARQTLSYGLSQYTYLGKTTAGNIQEQKAAFDYFNAALDPAAIKKDPKTARKRLAAGIHPVAGESFTKVGSYMAWKLAQIYGEDRLQVYRRDPFVFFRDYLGIPDKPYDINVGFARLLREWEKDWDKSYTPALRKLHITADTDFSRLAPQLKEGFAGVRIYPDYSRDIRMAALYFLGQKDFRNGLSLLELNTDLYPQDALSWFSRAAGHFWVGDTARAQALLRKTHRLNPDIMDEIDTLAAELWESKKMNELIALLELVIELYPRNAGKRVELARLYLSLGNKETAITYFREALKLNPRLKEVEVQLSELEKK